MHQLHRRYSSTTVSLVRKSSGRAMSCLPARRVAWHACVATALGALWIAILTASSIATAAGCLTGPQAQVFVYAGVAEECYAVPAGVTQVSVIAVGAPGGMGLCRDCALSSESQGADGAQVTGYLTV